MTIEAAAQAIRGIFDSFLMFMQRILNLLRSEFQQKKVNLLF